MNEYQDRFMKRKVRLRRKYSVKANRTETPFCLWISKVLEGSHITAIEIWITKTKCASR